MDKKKRITLQIRVTPESYVMIRLRQDELYQETGIQHAQSDVVLKAMTADNPALIDDAIEILELVEGEPRSETIEAGIKAWEEKHDSDQRAGGSLPRKRW